MRLPVVLDLGTRAIASRAKFAEAFYGLTFSKDGARLFCSGSSGETICAFRFDAGQLVDPAAFVFTQKKDDDD